MCSLAVLAAALGLASASTARAYESQYTLSAGAGGGWAPGPPPFPDHGPHLLLGAHFGIDTAWGVGFIAGSALHPPFMGGDPASLSILGAEATYIFDILQFVPVLGAGVDFLALYEGGALTPEVGGHVLLGVDYLVSREVLVGVEVRPFVVFSDLEQLPFYLTATARVALILDL